MDKKTASAITSKTVVTTVSVTEVENFMEFYQEKKFLRTVRNVKEI